MPSRKVCRKVQAAFMGCLVGLCFLTGLSLAQDQIFNIDDKKQLFIDDQLVAQSDGLTWAVNQPVKAGPVLKPDPGKEGPYLMIDTIIKIGEEYWMYYEAYVPTTWLERDWKGEVPEYVRHMLCLAKSRDGIH